MAKFKVRKGQDAYVFYDTLVEAESAEDALHTASAFGYEGDWVKSHVAEFDHQDFWPEEVEAVADDFSFEDIEEIVSVEFSGRERDAVLSSLRLWQRTPEEARIPERDIFTNSDRHNGLTPEEIDALCERINA